MMYEETVFEVFVEVPINISFWHSEYSEKNVLFLNDRMILIHRTDIILSVPD